VGEEQQDTAAAAAVLEQKNYKEMVRQQDHGWLRMELRIQQRVVSSNGAGLMWDDLRQVKGSAGTGYSLAAQQCWGTGYRVVRQRDTAAAACGVSTGGVQGGEAVGATISNSNEVLEDKNMEN
jgi:hypothetical protein